uniref:BTP domain-containing protein n=1 Tax=Caenorhabditis japonica TaxID=281687 RepID=A0A8R1DTC6_CAEJA
MHPQPGPFSRRPATARPFYPVHAFVPQQHQQSQQNQPQPVISSSSTGKPQETRARKQVGANFLPSIVNEAYHNVLEQVVTALCYKEGFDDIEEGALETIMLLFHSCIQ